eukprot:g8004.t1
MCTSPRFGYSPNQAASSALRSFLLKHGFLRRERRRCSSERVQPIHVAAQLGDALVLELLLEAGADPFVLYQGQSPLEIAKSQNQELTAGALRKRKTSRIISNRTL